MWECKELIDKNVCDKKSIWNQSNCECECDISCDAGELESDSEQQFSTLYCLCFKQIDGCFLDGLLADLEQVKKKSHFADFG